MPSLPSLITNPSLNQQVGAFTPLAQVASVVQTLTNIQGFNPGAFSQLSGSIGSALSGFDQMSNIVNDFGGISPVGAFTNALGISGLAGSSISQIAESAGQAFRQVDSFLSTVGIADSFARLSGERPSVEAVMSNARNMGGLLSFPSDQGKYWMALGFTEYAYSLSGTPVRSMVGQSIILPVPINLQDTDNIQYQEFSMVKQVGQALGNVLGTAGAIAQSTGKLSESVAGILGGVAGFIGDTAEAAGVATGYAVNTIQSLKFVQPSLKQHSFQWKLVPNTPAESKTIHEIIRKIKYHIYPSVTGAGLAFRYPDLINIYLYNQDRMYIFKPAFVREFSVNYTPDGGPAFYKSEYPVAVTISMSIQENSVWTKEEIG